jgi:predicted amidohydrolase YtcJ
MTRQILIVVGIVGAISAISAQQSSRQADLVLTNGKIVTVDERFTIAQAVAIAGDRILAVGTNDEINRLAGPGARRIDLRGRSVLPGLIDNHLHLLRAGNTWMQELRFDGVESRKKAVEMLKARAKAAGPGGWVFNIGGWAHQQFADDRKPFTRERSIRSHRTIRLPCRSRLPGLPEQQGADGVWHRTGQAGPERFRQKDRSSAMRQEGRRALSRATSPPRVRWRPGMPKLPADQLEASTTALVKDMNRAGLTSVGVPGCNADVLEIFQKWKAQGQSPVGSSVSAARLPGRQKRWIDRFRRSPR